MEVLTIDTLTPDFHGAVVSLGNFDGVHLGHQAMINALIDRAKKEARPSLLIVFEPQPQEFFSEDPPARLTSFEEKCQIFKQLGVEGVLRLDFDQSLAQLKAQDFIRKILIDTLHIHHILVGDDFRFGASRQGDLDLLTEEGLKDGFTTQGLESIMYGSERISSTGIRQALKAAQFELAAQWLGRPYTLRGEVLAGDQRGRLLGYPTANIAPNRVKLPFTGVYAVRVVVDCFVGLRPPRNDAEGVAPRNDAEGGAPRNDGEEGVMTGMANLGNRPTVDGFKTLLEVHIFNFNESLYGKVLEVEFCHKIRDEKRFESLDALKAQLQADKQAVESYFHHGRL